MTENGHVADGVGEIRQGVADYWATGAEMWSPYFLGLLADATGRAGDVTAGLELINDALNRAERTGVCWIEAELRRIRGELLLARDTSEHREAEANFHDALAIARRQGARMWELRASTSLARLWFDHGRQEQAHELLAPTYGCFVEGLDTPDLRDARALLDALGRFPLQSLRIDGTS